MHVQSRRRQLNVKGLAAIVLASVSFQPADTSAQELAMDTLVELWRKGEPEAASIEFTKSTYVSKEYREALVATVPTVARDPRAPGAITTIRFQQTQKLLKTALGKRYEVKGQQAWLPTASEPISEHRIMVFNSHKSEYRDLEYPNEVSEFAQGRIMRGPDVTRAMELPIFPAVFWLTRQLPEWQEYRIVGDVDGLITLQRAKSNSPTATVVVVDSQYEHLIKRVEVSASNQPDAPRKPQATLEIDYAAHGGRYVPNHWLLQQFQNGEVAIAVTARVVRHDFSPTTIPDDFELQFPPGTLVEVTNGDDAETFVIDRNGVHRQVRKDQLFHLEYSQATDPKSALPIRHERERSVSTTMIKWVAAAAALTVLVWLWSRRQLMPQT